MRSIQWYTSPAAVLGKEHGGEYAESWKAWQTRARCTTTRRWRARSEIFARPYPMAWARASLSTHRFGRGCRVLQSCSVILIYIYVHMEMWQHMDGSIACWNSRNKTIRARIGVHVKLWTCMRTCRAYVWLIRFQNRGGGSRRQLQSSVYSKAKYCGSSI